MNRSCTFAASLAIMAAVSALAGVAAAQSATQTQPMDSALPRYRLSVGQELVYESNLVSQPDGGSMSYLAETRRSLWVTRRNADGSWRVVLFDSGRLSRKQGNRSLGDPRINKQLVQFTIRSDGRLAGRILQDPRVDLKAIFPALPAAPGDAPGWSVVQAAGGLTRYRPVPSTQPGEWTFAASDEGPTAKVYGLQEQATYVFDPAQGLVIRSEARTAQAGARPTTRQTTRLVSRQAKDANWVLEFDRQADVYFQAIDAYDQAFADLQPGTAKVEPALAGAAANLQAAAQKLTVPMLLEPIQARLAEHAAAVQSARQDLQQRARMIRKPAGDWTLTDFAGRTHTLKEYRGKVVVMDFWYRGCVWCIRAMPQIQQLAEDFAGKPVAILGMNTDADPADARFVIDTLGLNYTNLQAAALPERYGIQMFPTLLVLDGQGIIRDVRMGFEPNLRQALGRTIEALLAEPRPAATQPAP